MAGAIAGLIFLIAAFIGARSLGEKFKLGCVILLMVLVILAIAFVALLQSM